MTRDDDERGLLESLRRAATARRAPTAVAAALAAGAVAEALARLAGLHKQPPYVLAAVILALGATLPLAAVGTAAAAAAVTCAALLSLGLFSTVTVAACASELVVVYRFARGGTRGRPLHLWAPALGLPFAALAIGGQRPIASEAAFLTVVLAVLTPAAGLAGIARAARGDASMHRAASEAIAGTLIEHTARGERARIARELHDVVAHHVSMIAVQAETARLTTPGMPEVGAARLTAIGDTARMALTEMRGLLGVLREDALAESADRRPQPGLSQLNDLLDVARDASGAGTRLIVSGPSVALDPVVELAAYRIAQEALTNARRHAPGAAVDVELHYLSGAVRLRIRDNGPGPPPTSPAGGHGLTGMHERATAVGGIMRVGAAVGGGFVVDVTLPVKVEEAGE